MSRHDRETLAPLAAALELAGNGWAVFPCKWAGDNAKAPLTLRGHLEASSDPEQIRAWWTRWPHAMIGAPVPATLLVVDLDPRNNPDGERDLLRLAGTLPETLTAWSGRGDGGRHLYYLRPAGQLTSGRLPHGVDLKVNGYCIVPPSLHPASGQPYRWDMRGPVRMSPGLRSLLRPVVTPARVGGSFTRAAGLGDGSNLVRWVERQPGNANDALYWAAKKAAQTGVLTPQLEADLVAAAAAVAARAGTLGKSGGERGSWKTVGSAKRAAGVTQ